MKWEQINNNIEGEMHWRGTVDDYLALITSYRPGKRATYTVWFRDRVIPNDIRAEGGVCGSTGVDSLVEHCVECVEEYIDIHIESRLDEITEEELLL